MKLKHVLDIGQFADPALLAEILDLAEKFQAQDTGQEMDSILKGKIIAALFFEPSTRTRLSFSAAAAKLGASVISMENGKISSSASKGESLEDTISVITGYANAIVIRHSQDGAAARAAGVASVPVINAGDGGREHPTQALLDAYTIRKEIGRLDNLHIAFGFDPLQSRTIHSLALLLSNYSGNKFTFIAPRALYAKSEFLQELRDKGATIEETEDINMVKAADIIYLNRLQEERFPDHATFESLRHVYQLTPDHLTDKNRVIMDPLPRIDEISTDIDKLPIAAYFRQAHNGLYVRMALLSKLFLD